MFCLRYSVKVLHALLFSLALLLAACGGGGGDTSSGGGGAYDGDYSGAATITEVSTGRTWSQNVCVNIENNIVTNGFAHGNESLGVTLCTPTFTIPVSGDGTFSWDHIATCGNIPNQACTYHSIGSAVTNGFGIAGQNSAEYTCEDGTKGKEIMTFNIPRLDNCGLPQIGR